MSSNTLTQGSKVLPIGIAEVAGYLRCHNWVEIAHPNPRLIIFESHSDDEGHPIQLVLPSQDIYEDAPYLITKAVNLLSALDSKSIQEMSEMIVSSGSNDRASD